MMNSAGVDHRFILDPGIGQVTAASDKKKGKGQKKTRGFVARTYLFPNGVLISKLLFQF